MSRLTVVMYHYVREIRRSRFPEIKGLEVEEFRAQLRYLTKNYSIVSLSDCIEALDCGVKLPSNSALLTFDDGYLDHFTSVLPILAERKLPAAFFPPGRAIVERKILDVNKIHFLLASNTRTDVIIQELFLDLDEHRKAYSLPSNDILYQELAKPSRYDPGDVIFVKRLLQAYLPYELRQRMIDRLFKKYVSSDEAGFATELYLTVDQIKHMVASGMEFGSHGWNHFWLNSLSQEDQEVEIDRSLDFLRHIGVPTRRWAMCYPYGAFNETTLHILREKDCALGFTTEPKVAELSSSTAFTVARLDTNDFPKV